MWSKRANRSRKKDAEELIAQQQRVKRIRSTLSEHKKQLKALQALIAEEKEEIRRLTFPFGLHRRNALLRQIDEQSRQIEALHLQIGNETATNGSAGVASAKSTSATPQTTCKVGVTPATTRIRA